MELVRELLQFQASGENAIVYIFQLSLDSGDLNMAVKIYFFCPEINAPL